MMVVVVDNDDKTDGSTIPISGGDIVSLLSSFTSILLPSSTIMIKEVVFGILGTTGNSLRFRCLLLRY